VESGELCRTEAPKTIREIPLESWAEFEDALQQINHLRQEREAANHGRRFQEPLYRGLGHSDWFLETTLERSYPMENSDADVSLVNYYRKITTSKPVVETLTRKRWANIPGWVEFMNILNEEAENWLDRILGLRPEIYEYLIYLRHHGFPSPLLDWTASPYVAALFAFDSMGSHAERVAIYALVRDTMQGVSSARHFFVIGPYLHTHSRHYLQQSQYSLCVSLQVEGQGQQRRVGCMPRAGMAGDASRSSNLAAV
jgi:hypothetical protein